MKRAPMFDAVYVISLARSEARWKNVQRVVSAAGLENVIRFAGVDEQLLGEDGIRDQQARGVLSADLSAFRERSNVGEIGCALSHARVLDDIIANNWKSALILEDDVELVGDANTWLARCRAAYSDLPAQWDIWYLFRCFDVQHRTRRRSRRTVVPYSPQGCVAYAVSALGARKLRKATQPVSDAADRVYSRLAQSGAIRAFAASPMLMDPGNQPTEIARVDKGQWIINEVNRPPEYWSASDLKYLGDPVPDSLGERAGRVASQVANDWKDGRLKWYAVPFKVVRRTLRITRRVFVRRSA